VGDAWPVPSVLIDFWQVPSPSTTTRAMTGKTRGSVLRSSWFQEIVFPLLSSSDAVQDAMCECVPPCVAKRIIYVKLSMVF